MTTCKWPLPGERKIDERAEPSTRGAHSVKEMLVTLSVAPATANYLDRYNALIARSKAHWTWPSGYLVPALERLRITPDYFADNIGLEMLLNGELAGFCAVKRGDDCVLLDHLWIEPDHMGRGVGAFAVARVVAIAKGAGLTQIDVWPDPPAEGFYLRQGFLTTGERLPSRIVGGPDFHRFVLHVDGRSQSLLRD